MGWRVAGIIVAVWAYNVATHQPIFAVCIGLLAGWLFGRGRHIEPAVPRPQATSGPNSSQAPRRATREPNAQGNGSPSIGPRANSATPTSGPPQPPASVEESGGQLHGNVTVERPALEKSVLGAPELPQNRLSIATRTSSAVPGIELVDLYAGLERRWTRAEQLQLLDLYEHGNKIMNIAQTMHADQKQVAIKLIRLLLTPSGDIENAEGCLRHGKQYTKEELRTMRELLVSSMRLRTIANEVQRTQLGVGWRLLEMHLPQVPDGLRGNLRSDI